MIGGAILTANHFDNQSHPSRLAKTLAPPKLSPRPAGLYRQHPEAVWFRHSEPALPFEEMNVCQYSGSVYVRPVIAHLIQRRFKLEQEAW